MMQHCFPCVTRYERQLNQINKTYSKDLLMLVH